MALLKGPPRGGRPVLVLDDGVVARGIVRGDEESRGAQGLLSNKDPRMVADTFAAKTAITPRTVYATWSTWRSVQCDGSGLAHNSSPDGVANLVQNIDQYFQKASGL